eukprot:526692-Karenia_brevis.AAC.1
MGIATHLHSGGYGKVALSRLAARNVPRLLLPMTFQSGNVPQALAHFHKEWSEVFHHHNRDLPPEIF